jgi:ATP-dependent RNA helicase RhlE
MTDEVDAILNDYFDYPEEVTLSASGTPLENIKQIIMFPISIPKLIY